MKYSFYIVVLALLCQGCLENRNSETEEKRPSINENIPLNEREMLMGPIESALDDLKDVLLQDESFFNPYDEWSNNGIKGSINAKLDGKDTVLLILSMANAKGVKEQHEWFYDKEHFVFYSEHQFTNEQIGVDGQHSAKAYKFYFEDKQVLLSVYGKHAFDSRELSESWTPICPTTEEVTYLQSRLRFARKELAKQRSDEEI